MLSNIGNFLLFLNVFLGIIIIYFSFQNLKSKSSSISKSIYQFCLFQSTLIIICFFTLIAAFIVSDFSLVTVYQNSHTSKPIFYKIAGTWGNHEGSMLLWVLILTFFGFLVAVFGTNLRSDFKAKVLSVQSAIGVCFFAFILFTSNPFQRYDIVPFNGQDLNPLLQDPGLAFHPPFLYMGYVGLSMSFSFAIAALMEGRVDAIWALSLIHI